MVLKAANLVLNYESSLGHFAWILKTMFFLSFPLFIMFCCCYCCWCACLKLVGWNRYAILMPVNGIFISCELKMNLIWPMQNTLLLRSTKRFFFLFLNFYSSIWSDEIVFYYFIYFTFFALHGRQFCSVG